MSEQAGPAMELGSIVEMLTGDVPQCAPFDILADELRAHIEPLKVTVRTMMAHPTFQAPQPGRDMGEMRANIMLAFRHLEDARMRLGKAVQAFQGGVSILDDPAKLRARADDLAR